MMKTTQISAAGWRQKMRVFMTGASGFIGSSIVTSLTKAGHEVVALARNSEAANKLEQMGAAVIRGELTDLTILQEAATDSDGVLHLGFVHDFTHPDRAVLIDQAAIQAMLAGLRHSGKAFVGTTGSLSVKPTDGLATENDLAAEPHLWRAPAEEIVLRAEGVRGMVIRLAATVHGEGDHSLIPELINRARQNRVSLYPGDGLNTWQAVFRDDAAELYRLALERGSAGSRYHGIAEPAIPMHEIAHAVGQGLGLPTKSVSLEEASEKLGWIALFAQMDVPTSSQRTQDELDWRPAGPTLFEDMRTCYF